MGFETKLSDAVQYVSSDIQLETLLVLKNG
jgi:hypothetical protein